MSALCWIFNTMSLWNLFFSSQHPYCSFVMTALKNKGLQTRQCSDEYISNVCSRKISNPVWAESRQKQKVASQTVQWLIYFQYLFCNCFAQGVIFSKPDLYITFIITWIFVLFVKKIFKPVWAPSKERQVSK